MNRSAFALAAVGLVLLNLPTAGAGPSTGGLSSDNVEYIATIPFENATTTGANFWSQGKDDYMVVTGWKSFSIYNITDPLNPIRESTVPFGFKFENEDVATNGEIMLFSETIPLGDLHIWNIEDVTNPVQIATVAGAGDHTTSCIMDCKWAYGSEGTITDLRDPENPKLMEERWGDAANPPNNNSHDVTEVKRGFVLTSSKPIMLLDARKDPLHPKVLAVLPPTKDPSGGTHSNLWPREMKDRFAISGSETCCAGEQCGEDTSAGITTWDTTGWQRNHTFQHADRWVAPNGTYTDGGTVVNAPFGCSAHWFTTHPKWKDGGVLAAGWYHSGTRFLRVSPTGKISEEGWFIPHAGGTSGAYFITNEIVYAVDYQRGIDILRYTGKP